MRLSFDASGKVIDTSTTNLNGFKTPRLNSHSYTLILILLRLWLEPLSVISSLDPSLAKQWHNLSYLYYGSKEVCMMHEIIEGVPYTSPGCILSIQSLTLQKPKAKIVIYDRNIDRKPRETTLCAWWYHQSLSHCPITFSHYRLCGTAPLEQGRPLLRHWQVYFLSLF